MTGGARVRGQFIDGPWGQLAAVIFTPPPDVSARFCVLHIPAAFEEMNKSRRMVALQARAFAAAGGCTVVFDPTGTGDSAGEHADATWARWRVDTMAAWAFMRDEFAMPPLLWGLRLGALLGSSVAADPHVSPSALLLWQPVASGATFFNQFMRLASAPDAKNRSGSSDIKALRAMLAAGQPVEVAGYELHPDLVAGCVATELGTVAVPGCPVIWRESSPDTSPETSPWAANIAQRWQRSGAHVDLQAVRGPSFWASAEPEESPALIAATTDAVTRHVDSALVATR
jgi:exosortase A-associated hydrolase 2